MPNANAASRTARLVSAGSGLSVQINANGSVRRVHCGAVSLSLFVGNEMEGGPANLYLRSQVDGAGAHHGMLECTALLGPSSPTHFEAPTHLEADAPGGLLIGRGTWLGIDYVLMLLLARQRPAWYWHVRLTNTGPAARTLDLTYAQDLALSSYDAVRMNEYYVSQYIDHTALTHDRRGVVIGSRQNQPVQDLHPWSLIGSLRTATGFATDALQLHGLTRRIDAAAPGLMQDLPGQRLQHEHSMAVLRDAPIRLAPAQAIAAGFFGVYLADHPTATSAADLAVVEEVLALPEAAGDTAVRAATDGGERAGIRGLGRTAGMEAPAASTLFSAAPLLAARDLDDEALRVLFPGPWRHEERDEHGTRLSFFHGEQRHAVLRAKELRVLRPHGQLLRTGLHLTPDEHALTSTVWMNGVFHSMVTQGHVSINRLLSAVHSYLGLFRAQGQRIFVEIEGVWQLLAVPSVFEMAPQGCRWLYSHERGVIEVRAEAQTQVHELAVWIEVRAGAPARFLIAHHLALDGDDGAGSGAVNWRREQDDLLVSASAGTELARRFPHGAFRLSPSTGTLFERIGTDELLYLDGRTRQQPYLCLVTPPTVRAGLRIAGELIPAPAQIEPQLGAQVETLASAPLRVARSAELLPALTVLSAPAGSPLAAATARLAEITPWFAQNALVHYLAPRGLEQYSGGGWGTRDVCQGPVELLLALGHIAPIRDILLRVMAQQNPDGDWPQWFMFFERERGIRAGDSHGDIALWPLVVLAQYLLVSGDGAVLDEPVGFYDARGAQAGERASVWEHADRALSLLQQRTIPGTTLAAYGHGDWNDSLQPVDPHMREHLCSAWTVTLQVQALRGLAQALAAVGRASAAMPLLARAEQVQADFQRLLLVDGVLAGYALFESADRVRPLLHPSDQSTGVHLSSLAMIHAILEDLFTPEQARAHLQLIEAQLCGPDGARLFDRPLPYHGGPQQLFQRAESATFFGREIGLMYMHAHLRYAQALAHLGDAERFFRALCLANPIGIRSLVPSATLRQANCYYSSSDAAFRDRYQASDEYQRVTRGTIALDGGWRVYSSGAGIAVGLIMRRFLGLTAEAQQLRVDPVMPSALDGLSVRTTLLGRGVDVQYRIGATGCGVQSVTLNGTDLSFTSAPNPHRCGAALVQRSPLEERLAGERNVLTIEIG